MCGNRCRVDAHDVTILEPYSKNSLVAGPVVMVTIDHINIHRSSSSVSLSVYLYTCVVASFAVFGNKSVKLLNSEHLNLQGRQP